MFVKIHNSYRIVVAIADSELIGKIFEEGKFQLNIKENFYKGEKKSKEEMIQLLKEMKLEDATFNIVGEKSVKTALEAGIINESGIKKIHEVPFALVLM